MCKLTAFGSMFYQDALWDLEDKLKSSGYDGSRYPTKEQQKMIDTIESLNRTLEFHYLEEEKREDQQQSNGEDY